MSNITRRTVLAGVPAIAASVPVAAAPIEPSVDLQPSDPALALRWRGLFARVVRSHDALQTSWGEDGDPFEREWEAAHDALVEFWNDLACTPVRTHGDLLVHAIIARHCAFDDTDQFEEHLRSSFWEKRGPAQLVSAVLAFAGLPSGQDWRHAIVEKLEALS